MNLTTERKPLRLDRHNDPTTRGLDSCTVGSFPATANKADADFHLSGYIRALLKWLSVPRCEGSHKTECFRIEACNPSPQRVAHTHRDIPSLGGVGLSVLGGDKIRAAQQLLSDRIFDQLNLFLRRVVL